MTEVNVITVGSIKESYLRDACKEYIKRLGAFCKINVIELDEARLSSKPSDKEIAAALEKEGKNILSHIAPRSRTFALCIEGKQLSSVGLSDRINDLSVSGVSCVNFIIGSSFGLSDEVKQKADFKLSMSEMTFPHQLARVMLLEQIYRAFSILNNSKYHK